MNISEIVSIIIPTYNDAKRLNKALNSINQVEYPHDYLEIIIVDDGSSDDTKLIVRGFKNKSDINTLYIYQENKGPAAARNVGIKEAVGKYLLIIDSDCYVDKKIINFYLEHFPDKSLGGVGGNVIPDSHNLISKYLDFIGVWRPGLENGQIKYLVTANAFFLKDAVIKAGLFDEDFKWPGGEEPDLCYRMVRNNLYFKYDPRAIVVHAHRTSIRGMVRMFFNHGRGRALMLNKYNSKKVNKNSILNIFYMKGAVRVFVSRFLKKNRFIQSIAFMCLEYIRHVSFNYGRYTIHNTILNRHK